MPSFVDIDSFFQSSEPILDVRSPGEYEQGHIPGAYSLPLFSNEERAQVGTAYVQQTREEAMDLGLSFVGPKLVEFVRRAREIGAEQSGRVTFRVHCWRGGMRSSSMAWLLETAGMKVKVLKGGYKAFRRWCLQQFTTERKLLLLGGMTGTGKTRLLHELASKGEQILDLEGLANHMGSAFGSIGQEAQPTTEQFSNDIAKVLFESNPHKPLWVEAESRCIGRCHIPTEFHQRMKQAPLLEVTRTVEERLDWLETIYGEGTYRELINGIHNIQERLGGLHTREAIESLQQGDFRTAARLVLSHYDPTYHYGLSKREMTPISLDLRGLGWEAGAERLLEISREV